MFHIFKDQILKSIETGTKYRYSQSALFSKTNYYRTVSIFLEKYLCRCRSHFKSTECPPLQIDNRCSLPIRNDFVKILGVIFDDRLNLEKHINRMARTCYANLGRIASRLTKTLKIQVVHSLILSHFDYCNALSCNLPKYLLHKLTKVLHVAVPWLQ